jgi:hypothetical protein
MKHTRLSATLPVILMSLALIACSRMEKSNDKKFSVIGFYTGKNDLAHISFVHEANKWFAQKGIENGFEYDSTNDWTKLNDDVVRNYDVVLFLDTRPEDSLQRLAFEKYMQGGGAWMGFHFAGFALTPSDYPQNWNWYHEKFLGSGEYASNTWRPTSAILRVEQPAGEITRQLPTIFESSPNEWYRWTNDLRQNPKIKIIASIDSTSFPLGTGPKPHEIWHEGYYPVVWTNTDYRMVYFNMGHNDMDYENKTNRELSHTFGNANQDQMVMNALQWLAKKDSLSR